jgi:drug/metabolite transporter (DMT)-like permease
MNTYRLTATSERWGLDATALREMIPAAAFVVLWSTGYIAGKTAINHAGPFTTLTLRFGGGALLYALFVWIASVRGQITRPSIAELLHSAVVGLLTLALQFGGVYAAFEMGASSGFAALVIGSMPLAVSLTAAVLGTRQPVSHWIGLSLGFAGVLLVLQDRLGSGLGSVGAGIALVLGLFGITFGTLYQKRHASATNMSVSLLTQNLAATLLVAPVALLHEHFRFSPTPAFVGAMLWLVLVNSGATFALLFVLLRQGAATRVSTLFYLVTPVTAVMGWLLMGEPMSAIKIAGFALAAAGVYVGTRQVHAQVAKS